MSTAVAVAAVTAVLKDLLASGMIDHKVGDIVGTGVTISAVAPDTIDLTGGNAKLRLNLFLHQVTPNAAWRNAGLPSHDARGVRTAENPLALDLHYLVTAYGLQDLQAEVLLGFAVLLLHQTPVLARSAIRSALASPATGPISPNLSKALRAADLPDQVEQIKITPASMNTEEMSRLWSALQAHYRPTAAYQVSVVLIESRRPARSAPPVLTRGPRDPGGRERGIVAEPGLLPPVPMIESVEPPASQPAARLGDTVSVTGHHLNGTNREVELTSERLGVRRTVAAAAGDGYALLQFVLPNLPADFATGVYRLAARVQRAGDPGPRSTNQLPLVIAPEITTPLVPPPVVARAAGTAVVTLDVRPRVRPGQTASLILGEREAPADAITAPAGTLTFRFPNAEAGTFLARLRVDGIDSLVVDRSVTPPVYFDHRITVT
ncbi:MAG TPA: DUF4255 domain-containing protein [Longimicrobium sp.]|nr:DUF4255 domain-containing protein [Longimicrobium sp.]